MTKINLMMELCIKFFYEQNFKGFIKALLTLRSEVIKLNPENIDVGLVDLIMDEEMVSWAASVMDGSPTDYDWEAAKLISLELQDILVEINKNAK